MPTATSTSPSPEAVLLVDRPEVLALFVASGAAASGRLAVVSADGTPAPLIARLKKSFRAGLRPPVLYIHDATTILYPFAIEPIATLVRHRRGEPFVYVDLGLPPFGAPGRRFGDPALARDATVLELRAIPPAALVRYCVDAAEHVMRSGGPRTAG